MCGILGILGPEAPEEWKSKLLQRLLIETQVRGTDATGLAYIANEDAVIIKEPVTGSDFIQGPLVQELCVQVPPIIIGHCRAKTIGDEKKAYNNHPISSKSSGLTLIHNGSIKDERWRAKNDKGVNPFIWQDFDGEVDSEALLRLIETMWFIPRKEDLTIDPVQVFETDKSEWKQEVSLMRAIDDAVYNASGGQACALLNPKEPDVVYLWRTTNPLYLAYIPEYRAIVFASTEEIAQTSLNHEDKQYYCNKLFYKATEMGPEIIGHVLAADHLVRIEWTGEEGDSPFSATWTKLDPAGGAVEARSSTSKAFEADKTGITVSP